VRCHWKELVRDFGGWPRIRYDVGVASGAWGERPFLEGLGFGLFAETMARARDDASDHDDTTDHDAAYDRDSASDHDEPPQQDNVLASDLERVRSVLRTLAPRQCTIELDGLRIVTDAILLAIMNAPSVGPRLRFSPDTRADDGLLHVVVARDADRAALDSYLGTRIAGARAPLHLEQYAVRTIHVEWHGRTLHIDDEIVDSDAPHVSLHAAVRPGALQVLVPAGTDSERRA
jgi:diacylglycerol kinase (ATP)